jgi:hypothetical protein
VPTRFRLSRRWSAQHDPGVDVVVQWVRTSWTKRSRGGVAATRRNAVPVAFELPTVSAPLVHEVVMCEHDDFQPRSSVSHELPEADGGVLVRAEGDRLRVQLMDNPSGMPRRWRRPPAVRLAPGGWLRWQINYRFSGGCCGEWTYRLDTLNLAYGLVRADVFLGPRTCQVDERAYLR